MKRYDTSYGALFDGVGAIDLDSGLNGYGQTPEAQTRFTLNRVFEGRGQLREYCEKFAAIKKLPSYAILDAHGTDIQEKWGFNDGKRSRLIQSWLDENDGKFGTLLLHVCNTNRSTPKTRNSLIMLPDKEVLMRTLQPHEPLAKQGEESWSIMHPQRGEITSYTIEYELRRLR